jgi:hypothetical protein
VVASRDEGVVKLLEEEVLLEEEEAANVEDHKEEEAPRQIEARAISLVQAEVEDEHLRSKTRLSGCKLFSICERRTCFRLVSSSFPRKDVSKMPTRYRIKTSVQHLRRVLFT